MRRASFAVGAVAAASALALVLTGCTAQSDPLAEQYRAGGTENYISGAGTVTERPMSERTDPVEFTGTTDEGDEFSRADHDGEVVVLNFWYASCPPCRKEAPDLQQLSVDFADQGVQFVGVNVRDQADTARAFAEKFDITYPSIVDTNDGAVQLALAGTIAPNAVPTTIVLDKQGRIAARVLGGLDGPSTLKTLISDAVAEQD
ncbi:TlpA disulfide reductase family protein [Frigoribacterium sp. PvP032]|uniref:TlpA family protein disulfide reductase n=1 Tax=Frigoribacterium sp. PvP032 TaxID=2806589 RepID=UPI001AEADAB7|nr:TlpA disulfide reductase family protein [Frigoribacterium sp. PvP032]MBP1190052.1 peroxiredoxin [Frigoribacterium sp. PvP032]